MTDQLDHILPYLYQFLLGKKYPPQTIGYTKDKTTFSQYKIVIYPSSFFLKGHYGTPQSIPTLPLQEWEGIPILFGKPIVEKFNDTIILYADIIASTFFLISRYEEMVTSCNRDIHGRFEGKNSLPYRAGFIHEPIVDAYGELLQKLLHIPHTKKRIENIYLTHDVDKLAHYRNIKSLAGAICRFFKSPQKVHKALNTYFGKLENDPWFTFPYFKKLSTQLQQSGKKVENVLFIKTGGDKDREDLPIQDICSNDYKQLFDFAKKEKYQIGLHPSYLAGKYPKYILAEKEILSKVTAQKIVYSRHHYLATRKIEDMEKLIEYGITDDFTMGYADVAGFRLGTCKAVNWINPNDLTLTNLTLHPLTAMDNTLSDKRYMHLSIDEAYKYLCRLIEQTQKYGGELTLLWHNTSVEKNNGEYHRKLYTKIIEYITTI